MKFLFSRIIFISLFFFVCLLHPVAVKNIDATTQNSINALKNAKNNSAKEKNNVANKSIKTDLSNTDIKETNSSKPLVVLNADKEQNSENKPGISNLDVDKPLPESDFVLRVVIDNINKKYSKENWEQFNQALLEFEAKRIDEQDKTDVKKIKNILESAPQNNKNDVEQEIKKNKEDLLETYAGMVGDKRLGKGLTLDITMETHGEGYWLLIINGQKIQNEKLVKTSLQQIPVRLLIDVNTDLLQDKIVNFTYQMPKDIRLKYGNQTNGYRIAIDLPNGTKMAHRKITKNEISIKLINQTMIEEFNHKQEELKQQQQKETSQQIQSKNAPQVVNSNEPTSERVYKENYDGLQNISKNASFQKIHLGAKRKLIVAIDAGHGGIDPGANGQSGSLEKNITLKYAQKLKQILEAKGVKVIMTRDSDRTVSLLNRVKKAKEGNADLFVSLHADAHDNPKIEGTTVYKLAHLDNKHPDWQRFYNTSYLPDQYTNYVNNKSVLDILVGMAHQSLLEKSSIMVDNILLIFKHREVCRKCRHGQRSLAVLRGLDMLSILIEIGYITNKNEEQKMLLESNIAKFSKTLAEVIVHTFVE